MSGCCAQNVFGSNQMSGCCALNVFGSTQFPGVVSQMSGYRKQSWAAFGQMSGDLARTPNCHDRCGRAWLRCGVLWAGDQVGVYLWSRLKAFPHWPFVAIVFPTFKHGHSNCSPDRFFLHSSDPIPPNAVLVHVDPTASQIVSIIAKTAWSRQQYRVSRQCS